MSINLKKETERAKQKYQRFNFAIDKVLGEALLEYLAANGIKQSDWFKEMIEATLHQENPVLTQVENVLTQAQSILALAQAQTILAQNNSILTQDEPPIPMLEPVAPAASTTKGQRSAPLLNPFAIYTAQGLDALRENLALLDRTQLYDIVSGYEFNRHHSRDIITEDGNRKRYNVFDKKATSTLVQYILDVVPVAAQEEKYRPFLSTVGQ